MRYLGNTEFKDKGQISGLCLPPKSALVATTTLAVCKRVMPSNGLRTRKSKMVSWKHGIPR